jgi:hypothetical protein
MKRRQAKAGDGDALLREGIAALACHIVILWTARLKQE